MPWQKLIQTLQALFGERSQLTAIGNKRISRESGSSAGIGYDREPRSSGLRLLAKGFRHIEEVCNVVHSQHAAASKCRIENFIASCEGTRVRCRGPRSGIGPARLDHDNGFAEGH